MHSHKKHHVLENDLEWLRSKEMLRNLHNYLQLKKCQSLTFKCYFPTI